MESGASNCTTNNKVKVTCNFKSEGELANGEIDLKSQNVKTHSRMNAISALIRQ